MSSTRRWLASDFTGEERPFGLLKAAVNERNLRTAMYRQDWQPAYIQLEKRGELAQRVEALHSILRNCHLCPRQCRANRLEGEQGICQSPSLVKVAAAHAHFGEEPPLVGRYGSGTIFFSRCNLLCAYCQNWQISHRGDGVFISDEALGGLMLRLQQSGCHNINLVTPTHYVANIVQGLRTAIADGLRVPVVYNCGGYEPLQVLRLLDGIIDIYLPDFKYSDGVMAAKYSSGVPNYPEVAAAAVSEMHHQVGNLVADENGIALRGLLTRHLVLPCNIAGTDQFVRFVAEKLERSTYVNLMSQYRPAYKAIRYSELSRPITSEEYSQAVAWAQDAGLTNVHLQA